MPVLVSANALARKRAEFELVKSEKRRRLITNSLPVLIAYVDADLRYRFNNDAYRVWFGVSPQEALGRTMREVTGEGFFQSVRPYVERALLGERVRGHEGMPVRKTRGADSDLAARLRALCGSDRQRKGHSRRRNRQDRHDVGPHPFKCPNILPSLFVWIRPRSYFQTLIIADRAIIKKPKSACPAQKARGARPNAELSYVQASPYRFQEQVVFMA